MHDRARRYLLTPFAVLLASLPSPGYDKNNVVHCIGNAHIDTAWLWPKSEVQNQVLPDTYNNALSRLGANTDYRFSTSASLHYQWAKDLYPTMFQNVKAKITSGAWEVVGGQVVEPDSNLTSGESNVRQFLYGKRFFKSEFGKDIRIGFVPDCFGFNGNMPQIMRKSGIDFWVTSKLTWNDTTQFHRGPFQWKGIDGSVLTAYNLTHNYSPSNPDVNTLRATLDSVKALGLDQSLHLYGHGDHGGGPDQAMIDQVRSSNANAEFTARFGRLDDYYNGYLKPRVNQLPTIEGELYLEYHRGTYTSQAKTKQGNRVSEIKADQAERLSSAFQWMGGTYPHQELTDIWKNVILVNQFHDILPGSSIDRVYNGPDLDGGTNAQYARIQGRLDAHIRTAVRNLANNMDTNGVGTPLVVVNPLSFPRKDVVEAEITFPNPAVGVRIFDAGVEIPCQVLSLSGNRARFLFIANQVPAIGAKVFHVQNQTTGSYQTGLSAYGNQMENHRYRLTLSSTTGHIASLYDKERQREVFRGEANVLHFFKDEPSSYDAWETGPDVRNNVYTPIQTLESIQLVEAGPIRTTFRVNKRHSGSTFAQYLSLYGGLEDRVDLRLETNWNEDKKMLKVAFPTNLSGTQQASFTPPQLSKWCATGAAPHWLQVDLGTETAIQRFEVAHAQAGYEQSGYNTRDFKIQTSSDGTTWTDRVTVTGNTANRTSHPVSPVTARYARLYVTKPTQTSDSAARIYDFQVLDAQGTNAALFKRATADGNVSGEEPALAVDGLRGPASTDTVATYEIAYGALNRSIKRNTAYEKARYEVSGHTWADLSEQAADYGVSILNDSKYGWDALDHQLRLTLLKSPTGNPGGTNPADDGFHVIRYGIYPHRGGWQSAHAPHQGLGFNQPLLPVATDAHAGVLGQSFSFATTDQPNVVIGTIKRAEDSPQAYIIRLYESEGKSQTPVTVNLAGRITRAYETDLIEWNPGAEVAHSGNSLQLTLGKYDLRTLRVEMEPATGVKDPLPEEDDAERTTGGTAFDGSIQNPANEDEAKAFDDATQTKWLVFSATGQIGYRFPGSATYAIREYRVTSANDFPARDPRNWQFQGSTDGVNWVTLDTRSNITFASRFETQTFQVSNPAAYPQYRLRVTANQGGSELQIAEIQMYGPAGKP